MLLVNHYIVRTVIKPVRRFRLLLTKHIISNSHYSLFRSEPTWRKDKMSLNENPNVFQTITSADDPINYEGSNVDGNCESSYDEETDLVDSGERDSMPMWKEAANFICDVEGTGLLGLPFAVLNGGVAALAALIIVPVTCCYTGTIMIQCLYGDSSTPGGRKLRLRSSIEELGEACWPGIGRKVVLALQNTELLMLSASYLVLCGTFLDYAFPTLRFTMILWSCIGAAVALPTVFLIGNWHFPFARFCHLRPIRRILLQTTSPQVWFITFHVCF